MKLINNEEIRSVLYEISKKIVLPNFKKLNSNQIKYKNNKDIVTSVDMEVENYLKKILCHLIKDSYFIGEETYSKHPEILNYYSKEQYCWTVDPIDGTLNFVKGKEEFAIMIALTFSSKILQSWIYKPITDQFMFSMIHQGTFLDKKKIIIRNKNKSISSSIGSISSKYWDSNFDIIIKKLKDNFQKINSYGSIGCEYFDIALGIRDFVILSKLSPWDHLPGILIIRESGGKDNHFNKQPYKFNQKSKNLIVSNSRRLNIEIINKIKELSQ